MNNINNMPKLNRGNVETEVHVPFITETENGYNVKVGKNSVHPMTEDHYIKFIELYVDKNLVIRKLFNPGDTPEIEVKSRKGKEVYSVIRCNLHGLWTNVQD